MAWEAQLLACSKDMSLSTRLCSMENHERAIYIYTNSSVEVQSNRKRGEADDDTVEEWEQMLGEVDFEREGWIKTVKDAKPNVEEDQATVEVKELRGEVRELKDMLKTLLEMNGKSPM